MPEKRSKPPRDTSKDIGISPLQIKWLIGVLAGLFGLYAGWKIVWNDIDNHWRQESIQKAIDEKVAADIKNASTKAETDLAAHKLAETRGNAWQVWYIQDFRAAVESNWYKQCLKDPKSSKVGCTDEQARAQDAKQQALQMKAAASEMSKEK